jgi:hypothetical protein
MRLEVSIPDQLVGQAQRAASEIGVSFDRFVTEAVQLHLEDEHPEPKPTPELIAKLRNAEAEIDAGKGMTMAQVEQSLAAKRAAWLQANPH